MESAPGEVGRLGSYAALRRPVLRSQHLQQPQARVHIQREPTPRSPAGLSQQNGVGYTQVFRIGHLSHFRILLW